MKQMILTSISLAFVALAMAGCGDVVADGCQQLDDCGLITVSADECVNIAEDSVEDGRIGQDEVDACADCVSINSCLELNNGDCNAACAGVLF